MASALRTFTLSERSVMLRQEPAACLYSTTLWPSSSMPLLMLYISPPTMVEGWAAAWLLLAPLRVTTPSIRLSALNSRRPRPVPPLTPRPKLSARKLPAAPFTVPL